MHKQRHIKSEPTTVTHYRPITLQVYHLPISRLSALVVVYTAYCALQIVRLTLQTDFSKIQNYLTHTVVTTPQVLLHYSYS